MNRSGKTQWMLDHLLDSVIQGQPYSMVMGHSKEYSQNLKNRFLRMLEFTDFEIKVYRDKIDVEGSLVEFRGPLRREDIPSTQRVGLFYDHYGDTGE